MKHIHTSLMTAALLCASTSVAAETGAPNIEPPMAHHTILGMSVTSLQYGVLALEGERVVSPRVSVVLGLSAGLGSLSSRTLDSSGVPLAGDTEQTRTVLGVAPGARFFLTGNAPEGLWVSPRLELTRQWSDGDSRDIYWDLNVKERAWSVGGAALVGYTAIIGRGLAIQGGLGLEAVYERSERIHHSTPLLDSGAVGSEFRYRNRTWSMGQRMDVSVGWAF